MTATTPLDHLPLFGSLSPGTRQLLADRGVRRRYARGSTLFLAGAASAGIHVVLSGRVRVTRSRDGRQHVVHSEGPGGTLGEVAFFEEAPMPATAVAAEPTECLLLGRDALHAAMRADPALGWLFLRRLSGRVRELVDRLDRASSQHVPARLADFLLVRGAKNGTSSFTLGMTQAELAEELGTVREVIVRALAQLRDARVIRSAGRGSYQIADLPALRQIAQSGS